MDTANEPAAEEVAWIHRIGKGDKAALEQLYQRYASRIFRFVTSFRLRNRVKSTLPIVSVNLPRAGPQRHVRDPKANLEIVDRTDPQKGEPLALSCKRAGRPIQTPTADRAAGRGDQPLHAPVLDLPSFGPGVGVAGRRPRRSDVGSTA